jgi:hypothetical protein
VTEALPDARRFEAIASSIAARPMRVAWGAGATWTDGEVIELDTAHPDRARDAVIVQAALVRTGALAPAAVRPLRHRPRRVEPYLRSAVAASLAELADELPPGCAWTEPEDWWGTIRADRVAGGPVHPPQLEDALDLIEPDADPLDGELPVADPDDAPSRLGLGRQLGRRRRKRRPQTIAESRRASDKGIPVARAVRGRSIEQVPRVVQVDGGVILVDEPPGRAGAVAMYPEWDERRQAYREDWCTVHEPRQRSDQEHARGADHALHAAAGVRRRLATIHLELHRRRRQPQGEELDLDAVIDHRVLVAAGVDSAGRVYRDVVRRRRDLGVIVLIDGSGSTGTHSGEGPSVTARQLAAASALVDAFDALGDRVAAVLFRSHGRRHVEVSTLKGFDSRFDTAARSRISAIEPEGFTRLGAAIRHASRTVRERSGSRRWLLVVLSDGFPFDSGYEGPHAQADVRRALAEARHDGVGALCLSIGTTTGDVELEAAFGSTTYAAGPRLEELGADIAALTRAALAGADQSRRLGRPA